VFLFQTEIAKRLNTLIAQILPFLSQEVSFDFLFSIFGNDVFISDFQHQQQVATAVDRAKQVTMTELNAIIGVSLNYCYFTFLL
jgi:groucho